MKPINKNVLLEYLEGKYNYVTESGLELQDRMKVKLTYKARVVAIGDKVDSEVYDFKVGDTVIFKWHQNEDYEENDVKYTFVDVDKILCVIN